MSPPVVHKKTPSSSLPLLPFLLVAILSILILPFMNTTFLRTTLTTAVRTVTPRRLVPLVTTSFVRHSHTTTATMSAPFLEFVKARRTHYALSKDLPVPKDKVVEVVNQAMLHVPSSFNSQSNRAVVLFGAEHDKFWGIVEETLKAIVPAENWAPTQQRLDGFKAGAGSVLFFEDQTVVEGMQAKFAIYADRFPGWATQSDAMLQFAVWTALSAEGLGCNLQHYNPLVDDKVAETWGVPKTWKLNAQLVFGARAGEAGEKAFQPLEERVKVFGL